MILSCHVFAYLPISFFLLIIIMINMATSGKIIPFKACAISNTCSGSKPKAEVIIPMMIITTNTALYFLLRIPPFHPNKLLIVAAAPVGEAMAEDKPAANNPILIIIGAKSQTPVSAVPLANYTSNFPPLIKVAAEIKMAANNPPILVK